MASTEMTNSAAAASSKTAPEHGYGGGAAPPTPPNYFGLDFALRLLLFASSLSALVLMVTSKQTKLIPTLMPPPYPSFVSKDAKFNHSPAFIYLVAALATASLYSIVTFLASASAITKPSPSTKLLFSLIIFDALMAGVMASATGSAGSVAYIGLKGNNHVAWNKICNRFSKFCRHVGASAALSLVSSVVLVLLLLLSTYSLYRRSR